MNILIFVIPWVLISVCMAGLAWTVQSKRERAYRIFRCTCIASTLAFALSMLTFPDTPHPADPFWVGVAMAALIVAGFLYGVFSPIPQGLTHPPIR